MYNNLKQTLNEIISGLNVNNDNDDIFGMELSYDEGTLELGDAPAQYNGNISYLKWKSKTFLNSPIKGYGFKYDGINRLTGATYAEYTIPASKCVYASTANTTAFRWTDNVDRYNENGITYDLNGNIQSLQRKGLGGGATTVLMDNLSYTYKGNQLKSVNDAQANISGFTLEFKNGGNGTLEYLYDANGNMTKDDNKGIVSITYNVLNLPQIITFTGTNNRIEFLYDASGRKIKKTSYTNNSPKTKFYLGSAEYSGTTTANTLEGIYNSEGRLKKSGSTYLYEFTLEDHLGNARISFCDLNSSNTLSTTEIIQEQHYYPFGLQHAPTYQNGSTNNKYQYNGIEFADELNLNWYDAKFRDLDPAIGRWT